MKPLVIALDTSALIAFLRDEPGAEHVQRALTSECVASAAIWSELAQKSPQLGSNWPSVRSALKAFGLQVVPVSEEDAEAAAALWKPGTGLSLADRLCIALGQRLNAEVLTADQAWAGIPGVTVIR